LNGGRIEQMAADIGRDVMGSEILFDQLHGREDRPLGTTGAEAGGRAGTTSTSALILSWLRIDGSFGARIWSAALRGGRVRICNTRRHHDRRILPPIGNSPLPSCRNIGRAQNLCRPVDVIGLAPRPSAPRASIGKIDDPHRQRVVTFAT
jgi:hypothetical protein